jgi:mRNA-degrading endonuclease toxin of MazEF toxin-antitoxin module
MTKSLRRGDVVYVGTPTTDGLEIRRRPAVVVQDPHLSTAFPNLIVAPLTTRVARRGPGRVFVAMTSPEGREMGLRRDSLRTLDNLVTVGRYMVVSVHGWCPVMAEVDEGLRTILGLHRP